MKSLLHLLRGHRVSVGYYMGFKTISRKCSCGAEWTIQ